MVRGKAIEILSRFDQNRKRVGPSQKVHDQDQHTVSTWLSKPPSFRLRKPGGGLLRLGLLDDSAAIGIDPNGSAVVLIVG
jgi:hypothetical protein